MHNLNIDFLFFCFKCDHIDNVRSKHAISSTRLSESHHSRTNIREREQKHLHHRGHGGRRLRMPNVFDLLDSLPQAQP